MIAVKQYINRLADTYFYEAWPAPAQEEPLKLETVF